MYNIESILEQWKKESEIDAVNLDDTSRDTARLHAKYLEMLTKSKLEKRYFESQLERLHAKKYRYYMGRMSVQEVQKLGWDTDPTDGIKILKGEVEHYFKEDKDLQELSAKIDLCDEIIYALSEIMDTLKWRHQTIKNIIDWTKFTNGA
jgi:hypothetical protein